MSKMSTKVSRVLSSERTQAPVHSDRFQRCLNVAVRYLSYRPRGEAELRERLTQRGFSGELQDAVINKLSKQGLVNDAAFAQFWKDNRESFRPRSQWLTGLELRQKGVANEIIDRVVDTINDEANAYRVALSKARHLSGADYPNFRRKLGGYLYRRGFSPNIIKSTLKQIWQDREDTAKTISQPDSQ